MRRTMKLFSSFPWRYVVIEGEMAAWQVLRRRGIYEKYDFIVVDYLDEDPVEIWGGYGKLTPDSFCFRVL